MDDCIMREITPLSERDCFYIADRHKAEFTYPIHCHEEFELNFTEHAAGVRRVVGDSSEVRRDYDLVLIASRNLEHVWSSTSVLPRRYAKSPFSSRRSSLRAMF